MLENVLAEGAAFFFLQPDVDANFAEYPITFATVDNVFEGYSATDGTDKLFSSGP